MFMQHGEQATEVEASYSGSIPTWLNGSLLTNGGASYGVMEHMFDGFAMLTKLRFEGGKVFGTQRYIQSNQYKHFAKTGKLKFREWLTLPEPTAGLQQVADGIDFAVRMFTKQDFVTDNPSVNVVPLPDGTALAVSEARPCLYRVDPSTLQTLEQLTDKFPGSLTTAHPKVLSDGTLVNFTRDPPFGGYHVYKQDPRTLQKTEIAFIKDRSPLSPAWVHDLACSDKHAIIVEHPMFISMARMALGGADEDGTSSFLEWKPEAETRVHVVPLDPNSKEGVRTFKAPTFFFFHVANAFEEGGMLNVDLAVYEDAQILRDLEIKNLMAFPGQDISRSALRRLSMPLSGDTSQKLAAPRKLLRDESQIGYFAEFPCVNPLKRGLKHRYVWCNAATRPTNMGNSLAKQDLETGEAIVWHEEGAMPGEPCFIPSPSATSEDDGVVLSLVMSPKGTSFALVLDGKTMKEVGRAQLPYAAPYRFHGAFVPSA